MGLISFEVRQTVFDLLVTLSHHLKYLKKDRTCNLTLCPGENLNYTVKHWRKKSVLLKQYCLKTLLIETLVQDTTPMFLTNKRKLPTSTARWKGSVLSRNPSCRNGGIMTLCFFRSYSSCSSKKKSSDSSSCNLNMLVNWITSIGPFNQFSGSFGAVKKYFNFLCVRIHFCLNTV